MAKEQEVKEEPNEELKQEETSQNEESQAQQAEEPQEDNWEAKYREANDKFVRLYSEFENFRRRTAKEKLELIGSASGDLIKDLLPVLDDMERAIASNKTAEDIDTVKEGFELVHNKFSKTLQSKGLEAADVVGEAFDAEVHEAVAKIPAPEKKLKGKIIDVVEKGYSLNEKVLRYSKVVVGE
jgi:molecular chaperone GrpE